MLFVLVCERILAAFLMCELQCQVFKRTLAVLLIELALAVSLGKACLLACLLLLITLGEVLILWVNFLRLGCFFKMAGIWV